MFELKVWDAYSSKEYLTGTYASPELAYDALVDWCEPQSASDSAWAIVADDNNDYLNRYYDIHSDIMHTGVIAEKKTFSAHILKWEND